MEHERRMWKKSVLDGGELSNELSVVRRTAPLSKRTTTGPSPWFRILGWIVITINYYLNRLQICSLITDAWSKALNTDVLCCSIDEFTCYGCITKSDVCQENVSLYVRRSLVSLSFLLCKTVLSCLLLEACNRVRMLEWGHKRIATESGDTCTFNDCCGNRKCDSRCQRFSSYALVFVSLSCAICMC